MKTLLVGVGAAGNKAVMEAVESGITKEDDVIMINSTSKDFPREFNGKKVVISPSVEGGCGKERAIAKDFAVTAIRSGKLNDDKINGYTTVIVVTSVEGGTGSGSAPIIAKFYNQVYRKNVHIIAFTGFEEDVRGLSNTVEFFQEVDSALIVQTIANKSFMRLAQNNKMKAEQLANREMCKRIEILTGKNFIDSEQNIDDTDILKVSNTSGYMTVESAKIEKPLVDQDDFNKLVKKMVYDSKSVKSTNPGATRIGVILNIDPASEDAIDYTFSAIKEVYGNPYECFLQKQWDEKQEYVAFIASGMAMPLDEIRSVYERYKEATEKVNKDPDSFFTEIQSMNLNQEDKKFDMIRPQEHGASVDEFLKGLGTK